MTMQANQQLRNYNSFRVKALADYFIKIDSIETLQAALKAGPKLVIGSGSNILFTQDFHGLVIKNNILGITPILEDDQHIWLTIGAGENWHQFVLYCLKYHYAGVENLSLIPGTVGAAPIQNIGAYGVELSSVFESLQAVDLNTGEIRQFTHQQCRFGYRDSIFKNTLKNRYCITHVTLKLNKQPKLNIEYGNIKQMLNSMHIDAPSIIDVSNAVIKIRQSKLPDPTQLPNAGSFFKNPIITQDNFKELQQQFPDIPHYTQENNHIKIPAGWLIEHCGLKGITQNGIGTHPDQALVIVNYQASQGKEIQAFATYIQQQVQNKFNLQLSPEVNLI